MLERYPDGGFAVPAGDLVFSVMTFSITSIVALCVIYYRRRAFQAELGGPPGVKLMTSAFFAFLWLFYIGMSSWKTLNPAVDGKGQVFAAIAGIFAVALGMVLFALSHGLYQSYSEGTRDELPKKESHNIRDLDSAEEGTRPRAFTGDAFFRTLSKRRRPSKTAAGLLKRLDEADPEVIGEVLGNLKENMEHMKSNIEALETAFQRRVRSETAGRSQKFAEVRSKTAGTENGEFICGEGEADAAGVDLQATTSPGRPGSGDGGGGVIAQLSGRWQPRKQKKRGRARTEKPKRQAKMAE